MKWKGLNPLNPRGGRVPHVCVCSVQVPCMALPFGGGSSVGPSPLCGSPVWVPCAGPLCGSPVWVPSVWVPCVGPLCGSPVWVPSVWVPCVGPLCGSLVALRPCGIYSRDVSRSFTRSRLPQAPRAPPRRGDTCNKTRKERRVRGATLTLTLKGALCA